MRIKREETSVYHVMTRVVAGERLLDGGAREVLRKMIWQVAGFCGVEVLAYGILSNHFHVLVRVPDARGAAISRAELLRRYGLLYPDGHGGFFPEPETMAVILADQESEEAARWEARLLARMHDVSAFMQALKQRFTWWFNKSHKRFGTLWAERFKSVLVEDSPAALVVVAAYIDLNPVRAGLVEDPADYRWSSYGEAMGGEGRAQRGLASVLGQRDWQEAAADYRMVLYGKGAQGRVGEQGAIPHDRAMAVLALGGKVPLRDLLSCRIRYLSDGAIFGSEAFVRAAGEALSTREKSSRKQLGKLPTENGEPLRTWRKLQREPVQ